MAMLQPGGSHAPDPARTRGPRTIAEVLAPRPPRVLAVALLDTIAYARRWLGARELPLHEVVRILWWEAGLLIAASCAVILSSGRTPGWTNVSAPAFLVLIALMMGWSRRTWHELCELAPALDAIVKDGAERARIARRLERRLRWPLQLAVVVLGAAGGLALGVLTADATGSSANRDVSFIALDAVTFGLGANVLYWLWIVIAWFGCLSHLESIELDVLPEIDPAIVGCREMVRRVRLRLALGLVCAQIPLVIVSAMADGSLLPVVAAAAVLLLCAGSSAGIAVCRRLFLQRVAETDRRKRLARLKELYAVPDGASPARRRELERRLHEAVAQVGSVSLTSETSSTWLIVATAVGPLLPALLALALGLLGLQAEAS